MNSFIFNLFLNIIISSSYANPFMQTLRKPESAAFKAKETSLEMNIKQHEIPFYNLHHATKMSQKIIHIAFPSDFIHR